LIVYLIFFGIYALLGFAASSRSRWERLTPTAFIMASLPMILFIGFRFEVGADWPVYEYLFGRVVRDDYWSSLSRGDYGFYSLMWLYKQWGWGLLAVNVTCALLFVVGLVAFARRQSNPWLAIAVAIPYLVIIVAMSATRQATAIGFLFLAINAFSDRRLTLFGFWVLCASLFHASAILMLGIVALSYTRNPFQSFLLVLALAAPAYYLLAGNLGTYVERYSNAQIQSTGAAVRVAMNLIPALLYLTLRNRFGEQSHERAFWRNLAIIALLCVPLLFILPSSTAVDRIALYAMPLQIYVLGNLPAVAVADTGVARQYKAAIILYSALVLFGFMNFGAHAEYWLPYRTYLA
jgi:hypothetical protein